MPELQARFAPGAQSLGVSTRSVDELVKALSMTDVSKSQVSRPCEEIDERVEAFSSRSMKGSGHMNSVRWTELPTVRWTVGAADGPSRGSTRPV